MKFFQFLRRSDAEPASSDAADYQRSAPLPPAASAGRRGGSALPRFSSPAGRTSRHFSSPRIERVRALLRDALTPAQPVTDPKLFAGRYHPLKDLIEIIEYRKSHVVIFGERGIGKTSLLHVLSQLAMESQYIVLRGTCGARSDFAGLFRMLLTSVPVRFYAGVSPTSAQSETGETFADMLPPGDFDARLLSELLSKITSTRVLIMLDEYDRIESELFRQSVAELIKNLSDVAASVQIIIAGVSSNLDELIGYIPSIRRNIIGLPIQRLNSTEIDQILEVGERETGLRFGTEVASLIDRLSNGSPYLVRLLGYHSSLHALDDGRTDLRVADLVAGLDRMVDEAEARLPATIAQRARRLDIAGNFQAFASVATAASTPDGWFSITDVAEQGGVAASERAAVDLLDGPLSEHKLIEPREGLFAPCYRFVDEGLANFLWISAANVAVKEAGGVAERVRIGRRP